jgi:cation transport protein ChaC
MDGEQRRGVKLADAAHLKAAHPTAPPVTAAEDASPRPLTRAGLLDGTMLAELRAAVPPGMHILSDAELAASLDATLAKHDPTQDVWLFGYGSLMWNPVVEFVERRPALVHGWHRRFCLHMVMGRGSPDAPGLMLALDRGGACRGIAFRIPAAIARHELALIWRREMFAGAYDARWMTARTAQGAVPAIGFTVNRAGPRYLGALAQDEIVRRLATATGKLGSCRAYLEEATAALRQLGLRDPVLERLRQAVDRELLRHRTSEDVV